jgi:hypothetical protein
MIMTSILCAFLIALFAIDLEERSNERSYIT